MSTFRMAGLSAWLRVLLVVLTTQLCFVQSSVASKAASIVTDASPSPSVSEQSSSTSSAPAQTHTIQVGLADHKFRPDTVQAEIGDTIEFSFYPANHSVVRATYGSPCIPYEMTVPNTRGFFSGFFAVDKVLDNPSTYSLLINDTQPIFFYCSAPGSCLNYAMVGAVNPNASTPLELQRQAARESAYMLNPGEPFPAESPLPKASPASASQRHALGPGAIAGIVVSALSVLVLGALLFFFWGRSKTLRDEVERKDSSVARRTNSSREGILQASLTPTPTLTPESATPSPYTYAYTYPTARTELATSTSPSPPPHLAYDIKPHALPPQGHPALYPHTHDAETAYGLASPSKSQPYTVQNRSSTAPPYGFHVNQGDGPVEMEGTTPGDGGRSRAGVGARWEEVGAKRSGEGGMF